jgi:trehalose/maltose transport system substrate-binding protein
MIGCCKQNEGKMMKAKKWLMVLSVGFLIMVGETVSGADQPEVLSYTCNNFLPEFQRCSEFVQRWTQMTGHVVKLREKFWLTNDEFTFIQQILAARNNESDILMVDVIWTEQLAKYLVDLNKYLPPGTTNHYFPKIIANNTDSKGRLVALPLFTSVGILYYRSDLLKKYHRGVPTTWEELADTATYIVNREKKQNPELVGFVWQGRSYEGLTCVALEWINSYGGGTIVDDEGRITVNNGLAIKALSIAAGWIGTISPKEVLDFTEEEARIVFQDGNAVFMRSWPFVWRMANSPDSRINGLVGMAPLPKGGANGRHCGTLGGWNLAVSRYSLHSEEAVGLSHYMAGEEIQVERALVSGVLPTVMTGYRNQKLRRTMPFLDEMPKWMEEAVARPSKVTGTKYSKVSKKFYQAVKDVLLGRMAAGEAFARLEKELQLIKGNGWTS